jgi:hypothetical protein
MASLPLADLVRESLLTRTVTCPNCWHSFPPEGVYWISVNPKLAGEPQLDISDLAKPHQRRFVPERFDAEGRAIDYYGAPCTQLACPRCRLQIPRASLEMPSVFLSILGAPGSGKSVFLTSMIFAMRQEASRLGLRFQDADLTLNKQLTEEEQKMFLDPDAEVARPFYSAVQKTRDEGDVRFRTSRIDGELTNLVPPYTFLITPAAGHPRVDEAKRLTRLMCLYDNAGEHFRPGADTARMPTTRHLAASKGLIYTFDPTKDRRLRRHLGDRSNTGLGGDRQDLVLIEAANRIREHAGIAQTSPLPQTLVVALTKFDAWRSALPGLDRSNPFKAYPGTRIDALDWDAVESTSTACRDLLWQFCREIVTAAESVTDQVIYAPVAAVGWKVGTDAKTGLPSFVGANCQPFGVLIPLLCLLSKVIPRVVPSVKQRLG